MEILFFFYFVILDGLCINYFFVYKKNKECTLILMC